MSYRNRSSYSHQGDYRRDLSASSNGRLSGQYFPQKLALQADVLKRSARTASSTCTQAYLQSLLAPFAPFDEPSPPRRHAQDNARSCSQNSGALQFSVQGRRSLSRSEDRATGESALATSAPRLDIPANVARDYAASPERLRSSQPTAPASSAGVRSRCVSPSLFQVPAPRAKEARQHQSSSTRQAVLLMQQRSRSLSSVCTSETPATAYGFQHIRRAAKCATAALPPVHRCRPTEAALQQANQTAQQALQHSLSSHLPTSGMQPLQPSPFGASQPPASNGLSAERPQLQSVPQHSMLDESDTELDSQSSASTVCNLQDYCTSSPTAVLTASAFQLDCDDSMSVGTSQTATDSFADSDSSQGMLTDACTPLPADRVPPVPMLGPSLMGTTPTVAFLGIQSEVEVHNKGLTPLR